MAPRLRGDLVATIIEEEGIPCVEVTDPLTASSFRFYDFEYALAQQLTGQPLEAVVAWASATYGVDLGPEALDAFIDKLGGLGFLISDRSPARPVTPPPPSASSEGPPFSDLAAILSTTVAGGGAPVPDVPGVEAFAAEIAASILDDEATVFPGPGFVNAAAPVGLSAGDATEYRLKEAASGLWEARSGGRDPAEGRASASVPAAPAPAPPTPQEADRLPPGLAVLGGPLPPPAAPAPGDTPLASIAHAMGVAAGSAAPLGALDAGAGSTQSNRVVPSHPSFPVTAGLSGLTPLASPPQSASPVASPSPSPSPSPPLSPSSSPSAPAAGGAVARGPASSPADLQSPSSWVAELVDQVDHPAAERPAAERRLSARPQFVMMPATPAPIGADPSVAVPLPRRRSAAALVLVLLAAAAAGAVWFLRPTAEPSAPVVAPSAPVVHVVTPQPTTFYRWYEALGTVSPGRDDTLSFGKPGRLQDAMAPGTTFAAGETIARLKGVGERELMVNKIRSRVAYLEQLRDSSRAQGDAAVRQAEAKLALKRKDLADAQKWQAEMEIRAKVAGEIAQLLVIKGAFIPAGAPVFHVRATGPQASFPLTTEDAAHVRALGFCRVETVPGSVGPADGAAPETGSRPIDCAPTTPVAGDARLVVDLTNAAGVAPGTQVRLASARYDGVFPVPRSAVVRDGGTDRVWVATGGGRLANSHPVELAATVDKLVLVARGLSVGDAIIVDPPPALKDGAEINVAR